jgi:hypothetical protein
MSRTPKHRPDRVELPTIDGFAIAANTCEQLSKRVESNAVPPVVRNGACVAKFGSLAKPDSASTVGSLADDKWGSSIQHPSSGKGRYVWCQPDGADGIYSGMSRDGSGELPSKDNLLQLKRLSVAYTNILTSLDCTARDHTSVTVQNADGFHVVVFPSQAEIDEIKDAEIKDAEDKAADEAAKEGGEEEGDGGAEEEPPAEVVPTVLPVVSTVRFPNPFHGDSPRVHVEIVSGCGEIEEPSLAVELLVVEVGVSQFAINASVDTRDQCIGTSVVVRWWASSPIAAVGAVVRCSFFDQDLCSRNAI